MESDLEVLRCCADFTYLFDLGRVSLGKLATAPVASLFSTVGAPVMETLPEFELSSSISLLELGVLFFCESESTTMLKGQI